jgi:hypothetical protein
MYFRDTKTTNEPTACNNKSDRPQVNIWDNWKTLKYLNINDSIHLKDLKISKYKRESKARMPKIVGIFLNNAYYQESYILIIKYSSVVTVAEWLDGSFESQSRLEKAQQWFDTRKSHNMYYTEHV